MHNWSEFAENTEFKKALTEKFKTAIQKNEPLPFK
jgi:hypothetical protein